MTPNVARFIRELHPVDTCAHGGLQAVRLARANIPDPHPASPPPQMVPLSAALAGGAATVSELGRGDVNRLRIFNRSSALLFGMSGELVVGGRQDRLLNSSVLIAPGATVPVAVSCIERNRWESAGTHRGFSPARATASPAVRSAVHGTMITNLAHTGIHRTNQRQVWRKVSQTLRQTGVHQAVPTSTLAGGMDHHAPRLDAYAQACAAVHQGPTSPQLGLALFTPGTPSAGFHGFTSIDCFASPVLMGHYAGRLVRGAALEAHDIAPPSMVPAPDATRHLLSALADQHPMLVNPAAGDAPDATEQHYNFDGIVASVLCHQDRPIHLSISPLEEPVDANAPASATIATQQAMFRVPGPANGSRFLRLPYGTYTLGRASTCDIQLDHNHVSRTHARLDINPARITIRDLGSTNGLLVNDEPILLSDLNPGDRIALGQGVEIQLLSKGE